MKKIIVSIIVMGLLLTTSIVSVNAVNCKRAIFVDDDAPPGGDGTYQNPFQFIQDAIDVANNEEIICVFSGTYYENIVIDKTLDLIGGYGSSRYTLATIIDGGGSGDVIHITADKVSIVGFRIRNGNDGIHLTDSNNNIITGNTITSNDNDCICLYGSNDNIITDNYIPNNVNGIYLFDSNNNTIIDNTIISNHLIGVYLGWSSEDNTIVGNVISNNWKGVYFHDSCNGNNITGNNILNNEVDGIHISRSSSNIITGNIIKSNNNGISFSYSSNDNIITGNTISNNDDSISLSYSSSNTITSNIISNNDVGISIDSSSNNNLIYNNYLNNSINAGDYGNNIWNISKTPGTNIDGGPYLGGNYWNDYFGEDLDGDGLGDTNVPHGPGDYLPLVQQLQNITYVDDDYNSSTPGWQIDHFDKIQDAIYALFEEGTIYVYSGVYCENVLVNKKLTLIGEDRYTTIINGGGSSDVIYISADWVNITEFTIRNSGNENSNPHDAGVEIHSNYNNIVANIFLNDNYGIFLFESNSNNIAGNTITSNWTGICLFESDSNNITGNTITSNSFGGINLCGWSGSNNIINDNIVLHNYNGIGAASGTSDNLIYNNYLNNSNNAGDYGNNIWNISKTPGENIIGGPYLGGNYWYDYNGTDLDGDGLGDTNVPHYPGDYLPLVYITKTSSTFSVSCDGVRRCTKNDVISEQPIIESSDSNSQPKKITYPNSPKNNNPPNTPTIDGPTYGYKESVMEFTAVTTDPDGDAIYYKIDWDDGNNTGWIGPYGSGVTMNIDHSWEDQGTYLVKVKAKDLFDDESDWSDSYNVTIYDPYNVPHYAVVVGEWDYSGTSNDIEGSYFNAHSIHAFLEKTDEWTNTIYRTNRGANGIISDLTWMKDQEDQSSISLFYYSGHGTQIPDDDGDETDGKDEALYCSDGNYIRDDDLQDLLDQFEGTVIVILEACHSGGILTGWQGNQTDNKIIMTACNEDADSYTGGNEHIQSVFSNSIALGWQGEADTNGDGKITAVETFNYAQLKTFDYQQMYSPPYNVQIPQIFIGYKGEIPLLLSGY